MTKYGQIIYEIIEQSKSHLTAEEIYLRTRERTPKMVLATVYNNLNTLVEERRIRRICLEGSPDRYDCLTQHDHLICDRCGKLLDIQLADLSAQLARAAGVQVKSYDLFIHYICGECAQKEREEGG